MLLNDAQQEVYIPMYMYLTVTLHYHPTGRRDPGTPRQKYILNRLKGRRRSMRRRL